MPQESFYISLMVPLLQKRAIFPLNLHSIASVWHKLFLQGRTIREGVLLHYSCRREAYYSVGRTNRGGRTSRGSTVIPKMDFKAAPNFWQNLYRANLFNPCQKCLNYTDKKNASFLLPFLEKRCWVTFMEPNLKSLWTYILFHVIYFPENLECIQLFRCGSI